MTRIRNQYKTLGVPVGKKIECIQFVDRKDGFVCRNKPNRGSTLTEQNLFFDIEENIEEVELMQEIMDRRHAMVDFEQMHGTSILM